VEPEKSPSLRSRILQRLLDVPRTLSAYLVSAWSWSVSKLSSYRTAIAIYAQQYKFKREQKRTASRSIEKTQTKQEGTAAFDLGVQNNKDKGKPAEGHNQTQHATRNKNPTLVRVLRFLYRRRKLSKESIEILLTFGLLVAAVTQAYIYFKQSTIMQQTLEETRQTVLLGRGQLSAASSALRASQDTFRIEQRPYVILDGTPLWVTGREPKANQPIEVRTNFRNIGKTPALQEITHLDFFYRRETTTDSDAKHRQSEAIAFMTARFAKLRADDVKGRKEVNGLLKFSAGQDIAPNAPFFSTPQTVIIPGDQFPLLKTGEIALYLLGHVSYRDSHGQTVYETEFCNYYFGEVLSTWHICDHHNTIR
jgi:hypothetical protein